nr:hypothetical protein Iba_chr02aCG7510 [Ipomoea batatas]
MHIKQRRWHYVPSYEDVLGVYRRPYRSPPVGSPRVSPKMQRKTSIKESEGLDRADANASLLAVGSSPFPGAEMIANLAQNGRVQELPLSAQHLFSTISSLLRHHLHLAESEIELSSSSSTMIQ